MTTGMATCRICGGARSEWRSVRGVKGAKVRAEAYSFLCLECGQKFERHYPVTTEGLTRFLVRRLEEAVEKKRRLARPTCEVCGQPGWDWGAPDPGPHRAPLSQPWRYRATLCSRHRRQYEAVWAAARAADKEAVEIGGHALERTAEEAHARAKWFVRYAAFSHWQRRSPNRAAPPSPMLNK